MKQLTVWECEHCEKIFRTPNRHDCKKDPVKKNCFSCKWSLGFNNCEVIDYIDVGVGTMEVAETYVICEKPDSDYSNYINLESLKQNNYIENCEGYEKGNYYEDVINFDEVNPF